MISPSGALARLRDRLRARFRLHPHWPDLLRHAWSVRFALIAALCDGVALLCGFFTDAPGGARVVFAVLGMIATVLAPIARLMPQAAIAEASARQENA